MAVFFLSVILTSGLTFGIWTAVYGLHDPYHAMFFGRLYNTHLYFFGFMALAISIGAALFVLFRRKAKTTDLTLGVLVWWWILALVTGIVSPGFSYLFTWPLLFAVLGLEWTYWRKLADTTSWQRILALTAGAVPAIIIFPPTLNVMFHFAPTSLIAVTVFIFAVLLSLLVPQLDLVMGAHKWRLSIAALAVFVGFLAAGSLTASFDAEHPRPNSIAYFQDTAKGGSFWFSRGYEPDSWTSQFFTEGKEIKYRKVGEFLPLSLFSRTSVITSVAPAIGLKPPELKILNDQSDGKTHRVRFNLTSARSANIITMDVTPRLPIRAITIGEHRILKPAVNRQNKDFWGLVYYGVPPEGIEITLDLAASQPIRLTFTDQSWGIPDVPGLEIRPRSADMLPMPNFDYGTVVTNGLDIR